MNAYELTFIVRPDLDDEMIDGVIEGVVDRIRAADGEIVATLPWNPPRRRMAYPIRDYGDGIYITVTFRFDAQRLREIENTYRLNDRILRFLVVQASDLAVQQAEQRLAQRQAPPPAPVAPEEQADVAEGAAAGSDAQGEPQDAPRVVEPSFAGAEPAPGTAAATPDTEAPVSAPAGTELDVVESVPVEAAPSAVPDPEPSPVNATASTEVTE